MLPTLALPTLRIRVTADRLRVELDGVGVVLDEEAVLALMYDARAEDIVCVGAGLEALGLPEVIKSPEAVDVDGRSPVFVPVEEARWLDGDRGLGGAKPPALREPWQHHRECVLVHPFAPGAGSVRTSTWLLATARHRILSGAAAANLGIAARWWVRLGAPVDLVIPEVPADDTQHDLLVRELWSIFGGRLRLNGAPAKLRGRTRLPRRDWGLIALPLAPSAAFAALALHARSFPGRRLLLYASISSLVLLGVTLLLAWYRFRHGPSAPAVENPSARALRKQVGAAPGAEPADFAGAGHYRFDIARGSGRASDLLGLHMFAVPSALLGLAHLGPPRATWSDIAVIAFAFAILVGLFGGLVLGSRLLAPRMSLGERGITLRLMGAYSRPLLIPYSRIRHAAVTIPTLVLRFHGGQELSLTLPLGEKTPFLEIEAALVSRLSTQSSYRAPGGARTT